MLRAMLALVIVLVVAVIWAKADTGGALVVTTCGTLPLAYAVGSTRSLTVNTNGQVCQ